VPPRCPEPPALPAAAISNGLENAGYNARRNRVSRYVSAHFEAIKQELLASPQPHLASAMALAKIPAENRQAFLAELAQHPGTYRTSNPEPLIISLMVYGR